MGLNAKTPVLAGVYLFSLSSIAGWGYLLRNANRLVWSGFWWFGGLTGFLSLAGIGRHTPGAEAPFFVAGGEAQG